MPLGHSHPTGHREEPAKPPQGTPAAIAAPGGTPLHGDGTGRTDLHASHPTREAILDAIHAVVPTDTLPQLQAQVSAHLQAHTSRADPARPLLVVMAEPPDSRLAKLAQLAVLRHFRAHARTCTFLVEQDPVRFDDTVDGLRLGLEGDAIRRVAAVFDSASAGRPLAPHDAAWVEARGTMTAVQCHLADRMKVTVRAYDVARSTAQSQDERESAMGEAIASWARFPGQVVVVQAGDHHAAKFHEDFQHTAQVIGICCLTDEVPPSPLRHEIRRRSYLLSHPEVLKLRSPALEGDGGGFFGFAKGILDALAAPPAGPTATGRDPAGGSPPSRMRDTVADGDGAPGTAWRGPGPVPGEDPWRVHGQEAPVALAFLDSLLWPPALLAMAAPPSHRVAPARRPHPGPGGSLHGFKRKERSLLKGW
jgi:hypothetical protein